MGDFDFTFKQMSAAMPVFSTETQRRRKRQALERKRKRDREAVVETAETGIRKEESEFDAADDAAVEHLPLETAESRTSDEADASVPLQLPRPLPREPENDEEEYVLHHLMKEEWKKVVADHMHLLLDENGNLVEWWFKVMADMRVQFWTEFCMFYLHL